MEEGGCEAEEGVAVDDGKDDEVEAFEGFGALGCLGLNGFTMDSLRAN